jgi:hypothetical protein
MAAMPARGLGGEGVNWAEAGVGVEDGAYVVGGDGTFAADAPVFAAEFDDGGGQDAVRLTGIEDEREAIAELIEDFFTGGAGGRTGFVGAGAGERHAEFGDKFLRDFAFRPTKSDAAGVGGDFQRQAVGRFDDDGERAGPAGFGEAKEIVGKLAGNFHGLVHGIDEDGKGARFRATFNAEDGIYSGEIDGVGSEGIERVRRNGNNGAALDPLGGVANGAQIGVARV